MNTGLPFVEHRYHWGVTSESSKRKDAINDKVRIYLIRDTTLSTIGKMIERDEGPDWDETKRYNGITDTNVFNYYKKRFTNLGTFYEHCEK